MARPRNTRPTTPEATQEMARDDAITAAAAASLNDKYWDNNMATELFARIGPHPKDEYYRTVHGDWPRDNGVLCTRHNGRLIALAHPQNLKGVGATFAPPSRLDRGR